MRKEHREHVTEGGRLLLLHIRASEERSIPVWCAKHGIDRLRVQKVINGDIWQRIGVDFAVAVERATGGAIKPEMFLAETAAATSPTAADSGPALDEPDATDATGTEG